MSQAYLRERVGAKTVGVSPIPYGDMDGVEVERMTVADFMERRAPAHARSKAAHGAPVNDTADDGARHTATKPTPPLYIFDSTIVTDAGLEQDLEWPSMFDDFEPTACARTSGTAGASTSSTTPVASDRDANTAQAGSGVGECSQGKPQFMMGPEGSGAPMHMHVAAFNAALVGRKRWFFSPPAHNFWSRKPVSEWLAHDYPATPAGAPLFECTQHPGDIMYVPNLWSHAVVNLEDAVAVATEIKMKKPGTAPYAGT